MIVSNNITIMRVWAYTNTCPMCSHHFVLFWWQGNPHNMWNKIANVLMYSSFESIIYLSFTVCIQKSNLQIVKKRKIAVHWIFIFPRDLYYHHSVLCRLQMFLDVYSGHLVSFAEIVAPPRNIFNINCLYL